SGSLENSRSRRGMPLFSVLLRKNRAAPPEDVPEGDRRFPFRVRAEGASAAFFGSGVGTVVAASSLFISPEADFAAGDRRSARQPSAALRIQQQAGRSGSIPSAGLQPGARYSARQSGRSIRHAAVSGGFPSRRTPCTSMARS